MTTGTPPSLALFPDTNVWLHFRPVREVDWCALTGAASVRLIVCGQVLDELDEKKYDSRLSDRATRALAVITAAIRAEAVLRPGVELAVLADAPEAGTGNADAVVIRTAQEYAASHPGTEVAIVTADTGMVARCVARAVRCISMPESERLPMVQDEAARRYAKLADELAALKGRLPQLAVLARAAQSDGEWSRQLAVVLDPRVEAEDVESWVRDARRRAPPIGGPARPFAVAAAYGISDAERREYNAALEKYYERVRAYVAARNDWLERRARTICLELVIDNSGGGPAEDVVAEVRWPDYIEAVSVEEAEDADSVALFAEPDAPSPPPEPKPLAERVGRFHEGLGFRVPEFAMPSLGPRNVTADMDTDKRGVTVRIRKLNHHFQASLGVCAMRFAAWPDVKPFEINYRLLTASHPAQVEGSVLVRVSVGRDGVYPSSKPSNA
jgi:hypothetical protein